LAQQCNITIPPLLDPLLQPNYPTAFLTTFNIIALPQKGASFQVWWLESAKIIMILQIQIIS
jgi:hypothetical protein